MQNYNYFSLINFIVKLHRQRLFFIINEHDVGCSNFWGRCKRGVTWGVRMVKTPNMAFKHPTWHHVKNVQNISKSCSFIKKKNDDVLLWNYHTLRIAPLLLNINLKKPFSFYIKISTQTYCLYIYIYIYIHTHTRVYIYIYIYIYIYVCVCVCLCVCMYLYREKVQ